jgi:hypothetical protein
MGVFYVCIDPPRNTVVYKVLKAHYSKVGVKSGSYSWFVREGDMKKRLLKTLGDRAVTAELPDNVTLMMIRRARANPMTRIWTKMIEVTDE